MLPSVDAVLQVTFTDFKQGTSYIVTFTDFKQGSSYIVWSAILKDHSGSIMEYWFGKGRDFDSERPRRAKK